MFSKGWKRLQVQLWRKKKCGPIVISKFGESDQSDTVHEGREVQLWRKKKCGPIVISKFGESDQSDTVHEGRVSLK
ncbi:hypothetical protein QE152_g27133 [Popillia japonica]|uniref:Uncharacterized protein n=1 Tax=Popillia japonica TaxID=7064 RepID=A0AAW1JVF9_POPJA